VVFVVEVRPVVLVLVPSDDDRCLTTRQWFRSGVGGTKVVMTNDG
jgi:hypothetical protein